MFHSHRGETFFDTAVGTFGVGEFGCLLSVLQAYLSRFRRLVFALLASFSMLTPAAVIVI